MWLRKGQTAHRQFGEGRQAACQMKLQRPRLSMASYIMLCALFVLLFVILSINTGLRLRTASWVDDWVPQVNVNASISSNVDLQEPDYNATGRVIFGTLNLPTSYEASQVSLNDASADISFDVLTIGTQNNIELVHAQHQSWAQHKRVRNFFAATEEDDFDKACSSRTVQSVMEQSRYCRGSFKRANRRSHYLSYQLNHFARAEWLEKKKNPVGWICAQQRPIIGLVKVVNTYIYLTKSLVGAKKELNNILPDYLAIVDDDTFVNLGIVGEYFINEVKCNPSDALVYAGCMVRSPVRTINSTFPFGGWGTFYSRGAIERMMQPIDCNLFNGNARESFDFEQNFCYRIKQNLINEGQYYRPGMNLVDLIVAFLEGSKEKFCFHSDWVQGFFINFYGLGNKSDDKFDALNYEGRLRSMHESQIYRRGTGNCKFDGNACHEESPVCHYMNATGMFAHAYRTGVVNVEGSS